MPTAAYIHIPFCEHICYYCDFNKFYLKNQPVDEYINALLFEMEETVRKAPPSSLKTIFIGGGTPTALTARQLERLLKEMQRFLPFHELEEFTIEVNPDSIDEEKLAVLKNNNVNRLSIGAQTFNDTLLKEIGRTHTHDGIINAVKMSKEAGFHNISLDVMFGLPKQTPAHFLHTLQRAFALGIMHLSAYSLQVERRTIFYNKKQKGKLVLPSEEDEVRMYELLLRKAKEANFMQYEISNFAKKNYESKHNLVYWNNDEYFGFGAGAHGYVNGVRYENYGPLPKYLQQIDEGSLPIWKTHRVSRVEEIEETMFMGLRKREGIHKATFKSRYGKRVESLFSKQLEELVNAGLIIVDSKRIMLTDKGVLFGNDVFSKFIAVLEDADV